MTDNAHGVKRLNLKPLVWIGLVALITTGAGLWIGLNGRNVSGFWTTSLGFWEQGRDYPSGFSGSGQ